ncbi:hypothetical protein AXG93_2964s1020 [Marchantia polymorpha subsp. ruderalis]|uniref:Uncharacterized protein n=1 Tax=Marchantia polymorpha subsp. ruderalis TaxID=1480154 RepID=A0A176VLK4_MARPO|nr:hypothetical protein AXG93_2964s1020 [Marchantia polymorpha subsp. ruderalis]
MRRRNGLATPPPAFGLALKAQCTAVVKGTGVTIFYLFYYSLILEYTCDFLRYAIDFSRPRKRRLCESGPWLTRSSHDLSIQRSFLREVAAAIADYDEQIAETLVAVWRIKRAKAELKEDVAVFMAMAMAMPIIQAAAVTRQSQATAQRSWEGKERRRVEGSRWRPVAVRFERRRVVALTPCTDAAVDSALGRQIGARVKVATSDRLLRWRAALSSIRAEQSTVKLRQKSPSLHDSLWGTAAAAAAADLQGGLMNHLALRRSAVPDGLDWSGQTPRRPDRQTDFVV